MAKRKMSKEELAILNRVVALRPEVQRVIDLARATKDPGGASFCANAAWYGTSEDRVSLKDRILRVVGWGADVRGLGEKDAEFLKSSEAYDVTYEAAYQPLSDCRNCACL